MAKLKVIELNGRKYSWPQVLAAYREQAAKLAQPEQPALFAMHEDRRPPGERSAAERYREPSLFSTLEG
jgi:hypothetical protein